MFEIKEDIQLKYIKPEMEVIIFDAENIVTASGTDNKTLPENPDVNWQ